MYVADAFNATLYETLNGAITGSVHEEVPAGTSYPYTELGDIEESPDDQHDGEGTDIRATLHVWAVSKEELDTIMADIDRVLHRHEAEFAVDGARCWSLFRTFSTTLHDRDPKTGESLRHGVVRYRFRLE